MKQLYNISAIMLEEIQSGKQDVSKLVWDEVTKVENMNDQHLKNAVLKLLGFSTEEYEGDEVLKEMWVQVLRLEWLKRQTQRKATLKRD